MNMFKFISAFKSFGKWDFKQYGKEYTDFGNYHYGVVSMAYGLNESLALRGAGFYQHLTDFQRLLDGRTRIGRGFFLGAPPYGDDPDDQEWIKEGIQDYQKNIYGVKPSPVLDFGIAP